MGPIWRESSTLEVGAIPNLSPGSISAVAWALEEHRTNIDKETKTLVLKTVFSFLEKTQGTLRDTICLFTTTIVTPIQLIRRVYPLRGLK